MTGLDKEYYREKIYKGMNISHDSGIVEAYGWIQAVVNTQNKTKHTDSEVMAQIRIIIKAYKEADKQYAKEIEEKLHV